MRSPGLKSLILLMAVCGCSADHTQGRERVGTIEQRIVGGVEVPKGAWRNVLRLDDVCTGVALDPEFFVTAEHCPTPRVAWLDPAEPDGTAQPFEVTSCDPFPGGGVGSGTDVTLCRLAQRLPDIDFVPVALGCERDGLEPGSSALLVGYGTTFYEDTAFGTKRLVSVPILEVGQEISAGDENAAGCRGDSGGPAFISVTDTQGVARWRIAGLFSSGYTGRCDVGFFTDMQRVLPWIEERTQREFSPCFDEFGAWLPSADCLETTLNAEGFGAPASERVMSMSQTCGEGFDVAKPDLVAPSVERFVIRWDSKSKRALVEVEASDSGWGVRAVQIEVLDSNGEVQSTTEDQVPPYSVVFAGVESNYQVRVTATDRASNESSLTKQVQGQSDSDSGCSLSRPPRSSPHAASSFFLSCLLYAHRRRLRRRSEVGSPSIAKVS